MRGRYSHSPEEPLMSALDEAKPVHAKWSEANREFLEFVERNPDSLARAGYAPVYQDPSLRSFLGAIQPWPLFFDPPRLRELGEMAVGMDRLVKDAIERFLENDPAEVARFYGTRGSMDGSPAASEVFTEDLVTLLVEEPSGVRAAHSRGDYIETPGGLKLVEFNAGGFIGGLHTDHLCERYLQSAPIERFLREAGRRARPMGVCRALFRHVVGDTVRLGVWTGGDLNVAMVVRPNPPEVVDEHSAEAYTRDLRAVLAEGGPVAGGEVFLCSLDEIVAERGGLTLHGRPVHAVIEQHDGTADVRAVFRAFKMGMVNLFSGPINGILTDKRNLVLLSEHADSDDFTAGERALIERHVPWTRRVLPARTAFRGQPLRLPDDLMERRDDLVLKRGWSSGGVSVVVGRYHTPDAWGKAIERALWEEDWVVQERLDTLPYCFQHAEAGAVAHSLVWGLFVFGEHFGGVHLRMQREGSGGGVVNTNQGADIGAGLALVD